MKFIDLTKTSPEVCELTAQEINELLLNTTRRSFNYNLEHFERNEHLLTLVRWPDPVGFGLVAAQPIKNETLLFFYGGELVTNLDGYTGNKHSAYLQTVNSCKSTWRDAEKFGDFGSLLAHAPNNELLKSIGFSATDEANVQTENTACLIDDKINDLVFFASRDIPAGSVITHNYGMDYWKGSQQSFSLFRKDCMELLDLSTMRFNGAAYVAAFSDYPVYDSNNRKTGNELYVYKAPLSIIFHLLRLANAVAKNPTDMETWGAWSEITAHVLRFRLQIAIEKSVLAADDAEVLFREIPSKNDKTAMSDNDATEVTNIEFACKPKDFMPILHKISPSSFPLEPAPADHPRLNSVLAFFDARHVQRYVPDSSMDSCEPPPGSQIYNGKTFLPNPLKMSI